MQPLRCATPTGSRILGVGGYRPNRIVDNREICARIDSTVEWIESRSGIRRRRFAGTDETLCAMAVLAAHCALDHAAIGAADVDCIVVASMSNLVQTPPLAVLVADELGAAHAGAFDVSGACAGFCHALAVASDTVRSGNARHVLVIGTERMTDIIDPADRSVAFMFADGAGAALVGEAADTGIGPTVRWADGSCRSALSMSSSWSALRADPTLPAPVMRMDGQRVFRWVLDNAVAVARRAMAAAGIGVGELAAFIPHQTNVRMIEVLADLLDLPNHVVAARDVVEAGNTSAASVPLAMTQLLATQPNLVGRPALLVGFGAGLNCASQVALLPGGAR